MGTPIPRIENELQGLSSGPVTTYKLSQQELERLRMSKIIEKKEKPKFNLTKKKYLSKRLSGKSRRDIVIENCK